MAANVTDETLSSGIYRMGHGAFFRRLAARQAAKWLWICGSVVLFSLVMALVVDVRWLVVSFAVICLGFPMLAAFLYFYHGLRKECFVNIVPHSLHVEPGKDDLTVTLYRLEDSESEDDDTWEEEDGPEKEMDKVTENGEKGREVREEPERDKGKSESDGKREPVYMETGKFRFPLADLKPYAVGKDSVTVPVGRGFIWIPRSAWGEESGFVAFIKALYAPTLKVLDKEINET
jgi:hypothetical protein